MIPDYEYPGTIEDWRRYLNGTIDEIESQGYAELEWLAAGHASCPLCASRHEKIYAIDEARRIVATEFCKPHPGDGCRCLLLPVGDPKMMTDRPRSGCALLLAVVSLVWLLL